MGKGVVGGEEEARQGWVEREWEQLKARGGPSSAAMDELLGMSGLDSVKARFLNIAQAAVLDRERG
ncbi:unnamed protein product [Discosporangium mesarthrocarpum]